MFTATTFQLIKKNCLTEFENLLGKLGIIIPDWSGDEFLIYDRLDAELTEKICGLMKSPTILDGYMNFLDLGGIAYSYNEPDELLGKVAANRDKILYAVNKANEEYGLWQAQWGNVSPAPERIDVIKIEADTAKPFDNPANNSWLKDLWTLVKKRLPDKDKYTNSYRVAYHNFEECNTAAKPLLESEGQKSLIRVEDVGDWIQKQSENLHYNETKIFCLKVTKGVEYQAKEIPTEPFKSDFTVDEAKETLNILTQLNEIISLAR